MPQLHLASSLRGTRVRRESFDPTNQEHLESLRKFVSTGSWGEVKFFAEAPFTEVPATVMMKYAAHTLGTTQAVKTVKEVGVPEAQPVLTGIVSPIAEVPRSVFSTIVQKTA